MQIAIAMLILCIIMVGVFGGFRYRFYQQFKRIPDETILLMMFFMDLLSVTFTIGFVVILNSLFLTHSQVQQLDQLMNHYFLIGFLMVLVLLVGYLYWFKRQLDRI